MRPLKHEDPPVWKRLDEGRAKGQKEREDSDHKDFLGDCVKHHTKELAFYFPSQLEEILDARADQRDDKKDGGRLNGVLQDDVAVSVLRGQRCRHALLVTHTTLQSAGPAKKKKKLDCTLSSKRAYLFPLSPQKKCPPNAKKQAFPKKKIIEHWTQVCVFGLATSHRGKNVYCKAIRGRKDKEKKALAELAQMPPC